MIRHADCSRADPDNTETALPFTLGHTELYFVSILTFSQHVLSLTVHSYKTARLAFPVDQRVYFSLAPVCLQELIY